MHETASLPFDILSVFLTIFLAYDDAQMRKEKERKYYTLTQ